MKVKRKLYSGILCLAVVTALVAVTVKTDLFKYVFAHATLGDGWSMNDDGMIKVDAPDGAVAHGNFESPLKIRTRMLRSIGTDFGENSEP